MNSLGGVAQLGAAQGLMLILAILSLRFGNRRANWMLAAFIFVESLRLLVLSFNYATDSYRYSWLYPLLHLSYTLGPLLYFYSRLLVDPMYRLTLNRLWHFTPVLIATGMFIPGGVLLSDNIMDYRSFDALPVDEYRRVILATLPTFLSLFIYSLLALHFLHRHGEVIRQQFSSIESINLRWLQVLVWFCLITAIVSCATELLRAYQVWSFGPRVMVSVVLSVLMIYYIGLLGLRQPVIFDQGERPATNTGPEAEASKEPLSLDSTEQKYRKSGLDDEHIQRLWQKLLILIEGDKPYLQPGLKLAELANLLGTRPNYLSQVINSQAQQNFFDFINQHRIEDAKKILKHEPGRSIADIALAVGFGSLNVFNGHFKKRVGLTPSQFRKQQ